MKKQIFKGLLSPLLLLLCVSSYCQTPPPSECVNTNGDFESYSAPPVAGNSWINDKLINWKVSHGSPTTIISPDIEIWMWSYRDAGTTVHGEGVYTDYNFIIGRTYSITYDLWRSTSSDSRSEFNVRLNNGLTPPVTATTVVPDTLGTQLISHEHWDSAGSWITITDTFKVSGNYDQVWFYPYLNERPWLGQAVCKIDDICIQEVLADPCEVEAHFDYTIGEEWCHVTFENTSIYPVLGNGFQVLNTTWDFDDGSTASGNIVNHAYAEPGTYSIEMIVWATNGVECCQTTLHSTIEVSEICSACDVMLGADFDVIGGNPFTFNATIFPDFHNSKYGYYWDFGDLTFGTGQSIEHAYAIPGTYTVTLRLFYYNERTGECCSYEISKDIYAGEIPVDGGGDDPGGYTPVPSDGEQENLNELKTSSKIKVFPNPSTGYFTVISMDTFTIKTITVYNITGKMELSKGNTDANNLCALDLSNLSKGTYTLIINENDEENSEIKTLIIQ